MPDDGLPLPPHEGSPYREPGAPLAAQPPPEAAAVRWTTLLLFALAGIVLWIVNVAWHEHRLTAAVAAMPVDVQQETFAHIHDELLHVCAVERSRLDDRCREQATFILKFPQCDAACQTMAMPFLTNGSRK